MTNPNKPRIVYTGPIESLSIVERILGATHEVVRAEPTPESMLPLLTEASAVLDASMKVRLEADTFNSAPNLKLIVVAATGADHIDEAAAAEKSIRVLTLKGQKEVLNGITAAAEHSWLLLLAAARKLRPAIHDVENGEWERVRFPGLMIKGKTLGLVGFGRIGSWMARYGNAFGMNILAFDPYIESVPDYVTAASLDDILAQSDFLSLHVHLTPETKDLLNEASLAKTKPGVVIVNTARHDLINETAMISAMESKHVRAYATDFIATEPLPKESELWQYAQKNQDVIITPHIGGFCPEAVDIVVEFSAKRILENLKTS